ncbi:MAG: 3-hydroxyacyl-ACP dehydratase [Bacteroidales bacterium]|nr:MAG: 3-hydroxyacyl-ACP dehydratase [Bacteroidales bacterium]
MTLPRSTEDLIPQKRPFVLVHRLISFSDTVSICEFIVPEKHPLVNNGKLSEGGLIENIAQTAAAGNGYQANKTGIDVPKGFIAGIKNVKIIRLPKVLSILKTIVTQENRVMNYNLIKGEVFLNDELIASCNMKIYCP